VIARQHPQAAGIDRQGFMQAKFHREICGSDGSPVPDERTRRPQGLVSDMYASKRQDAVVQRKVFLVIRGLVEARPADLGRNWIGLWPRAFPQVIIDAAKRRAASGCHVHHKL